MLTFKDPAGVECALLVGWRDPGDSPNWPASNRDASYADLLRALGLSTEGGPTDYDLEKLALDAYTSSWKNGATVHESQNARRRALYSAGVAFGSASRQPEVDRLTARVAELTAKLSCTEIKLADTLGYESLHPPAFDDMLEELCAHRRAWAEKDGNTPGYNNEKARAYGRIAYEQRQRAQAAESELAATKARLAEVERERDSAARVSEGRAKQRDELSTAYHQAQTELERARRVVEAATEWERAVGGLDHARSSPEFARFVPASERGVETRTRELRVAVVAFCASAAPAAPDPRDAELERLRDR